MLSRNYLGGLGKISNRAKRIFKYAGGLPFALLVACQSAPTPSVIRDEAQLPQQVALGDAEIISLEKKLSQRGIDIVSIGQDYLLSIPSTSLFADQSPRIRWSAYDELNELACYLRQLRKVGMEITGYTSRYVSGTREHALSTARAEAVANYLWSQGLDTRLLFFQGMGDDKPIVTAARARTGDKSPNSRIEITFRRVVA